MVSHDMLYLNLGKLIYANISGDIVMSSSVLDHWLVIMNHNDIALQITNSECI